ncbi:Rieske 2Fe-2S domain-containing protein [Aquabacter sp. CN5-332]|uniref:Rieske (2Fe-2S) protein n=1 Tax=Aquabacter sp. CN5-332 TaxID=3156608 RepID=UPI0032B50A0A
MTRWVPACRTDAFKGKQIVAATVEGVQLIIIRDGERLVAAERACPHEAADLADGRCSDGKLLCPRHLAWFDLNNGTAAGWLFRPLRLYDARQVGDEVQVDLAGLVAS